MSTLSIPLHLDEISKFVLDYGLCLNDKTRIINNTKKRFKKKLKLIKKGKIENGKNVIASYKGYFKLGNCYHLFKKFDFKKILS